MSMKEKVEAATSTSQTVSEVPSTAMNPLGTMYLSTCAGALTTTHSESPSGVSETSSPTPSTCPWTKWPELRPSAGSARSRFTTSPAASDEGLRLVRRSVSGARPTRKTPEASSKSTTVRQTPLTAIEQPRLAPPSTVCPRTASSHPEPTEPSHSFMSVRSPSASTVPISSTMPENMARGSEAAAGRAGRRRMANGCRATAGARQPETGGAANASRNATGAAVRK
mmetsp:Transcript_32644/g.76402  ORF Transcript_32644/g.76402 Transcript_32644/m.76402 type:complete len:225 (+) Transcript_32644:368-1042(+)